MKTEKEKLKICYLSGVNSPHTQKWCAFFAERGHEVHLVTFDDGKIDNVNIHYLNTGAGSNSSQFKKLSYFFQGRKVKELINQINPDIIHAHRLTGYAFLAAQTCFHPYVLSVWGSDVYDFPYKSPLHRYFVKYNLRNADYVFSTSHVMKRQTNKFTNKDISVTPFGVDVNLFKPKERIQNNLHNQPLVIGTIKTLEKKYGIEYLIRAFKIVLDCNPDLNLELFIAGRGSQKSNLENLVKDFNIDEKVFFAGFLSGNKVIEAYQNLDIAVFPSVLDSESFGVAAVEAQACSIPVIVSDVGGLPEATLPERSAILVDPGNAEMLAKAIEKLIKNPELRIAMGNSGRKFVKENYNIEANFQDVENLYYSIIKKVSDKF
jgi:glycosyltransferase involved in cell wall biosynthesis